MEITVRTKRYFLDVGCESLREGYICWALKVGSAGRCPIDSFCPLRFKLAVEALKEIRSNYVKSDEELDMVVRDLLRQTAEITDPEEQELHTEYVVKKLGCPSLLKLWETFTEGTWGVTLFLVLEVANQIRKIDLDPFTESRWIEPEPIF